MSKNRDIYLYTRLFLLESIIVIIRPRNMWLVRVIKRETKMKNTIGNDNGYAMIWVKRSSTSHYRSWGSCTKLIFVGGFLGMDIVGNLIGLVNLISEGICRIYITIGGIRITISNKE